MDRKHTNRTYENELQTLREELLSMGQKVEEMIASSVRALTERDSALAYRMFEFDHRINRAEVEIDEICLRILARRQPVASDLRFVTIALKFVTDLERIGDLGVNICERAIELNAEPPLRGSSDLPKMAETVQAMVHDALGAFIAKDAERAEKVIERDRFIDAYYGQIFREMLMRMMEDRQNIYRATRVQWIGKYLERIGDHATNLSEMVVFMVRGKDIRHTGSFEIEGRKVAPHGILFLCVHNSARSQMAEGWARKLVPSHVRVWSAGSEPTDSVHPYAVRVMHEVGIDISSQRPKRVSDVPLGDVDTIVTLCSDEVCIIPGEKVRRETWALPDPVAAVGSEGKMLETFRAVRDELRRLIDHLMSS